MPLHPEVEALLREFDEQGLRPFSEMTVLEARAMGESLEALQGEMEDVADVRDVLVQGAAGHLSARLYYPYATEAPPVLIYFHGGGWVMGSIESADKPCRSLANAAGCVVVSVGYRLSPDTKYPGPAEDCYAATAWIADHVGALGGDPRWLGVSGDSAGANLAAAVTLMARDRGGPHLSYQVLIYPVTAPARASVFESYAVNGQGYLLTSDSMRWFWDHYTSTPADADEPYASPLRAENLSGLPPALVVTAEFDPLRDEGRAYAQRLKDAGVRVEALEYNGAIHGFLWMNGRLEQGREATAAIGSHLRKQFPLASMERTAKGPQSTLGLIDSRKETLNG
jgi:acetyl esterase